MNEEERLKKILGVAAKNLNIKKWRFERRDLSADLVNYCSNFISVLVIDEISNEEYSILVKFPPDWPDFANLVDRFFSTELSVYSTLLPIFRSFGRRIDIDNLFPKCYYGTNNEEHRALVLQDMSSKGFEKRQCGDSLDNRHMKVALGAISKFHALSFMAADNTDLKIFCREYPESIFVIAKKAQTHVLLILKDKSYVKLVDKYSNNFEKNIEECVSKAKGQTYGHGDCNKENILFKYSEQIPIEACLIDFQHTRRINLAQDVLFFITTSTDEKFRKTHFNELINYYYHNLQEIVSSAGLEGKQLYPEEDFNHDLELVFPAFLVTTIFSYALWFGVIDIKGNLKDDNAAAKKKFVKSVDNLISDFIEFGYIRN